MATNRLLLVDTTTGDVLVIATTFCHGWVVVEGLEARLQAWLDQGPDDEPRDYSAGWQPTQLVLEDELGEPSKVAAERDRAAWATLLLIAEDLEADTARIERTGGDAADLVGAAKLAAFRLRDLVSMQELRGLSGAPDNIEGEG